MIEDKVWTNHFGVPDAEIKVGIIYNSVKRFKDRSEMRFLSNFLCK